MTEVEILEERFGPRYFKRGKEAKPEPEPEPESEEPEPDVPELSAPSIAERFTQQVARTGLTVLKYDRKRGGGYVATMRHLRINAKARTLSWHQRKDVDYDRKVQISDIQEVLEPTLISFANDPVATVRGSAHSARGS